MKVLKKISIVLILLGFVLAIGCNSSTTEKAPPLPGEKKTIPPDVYVPANQTPEKYLDKYYKLYTDGNFKEAYKMLPASKKAEQSEKEYEDSHKTLPVESYKLGAKKQKGDQVVIEAKLKLKQFGTWTVSWYFVKDSKGYKVEDYAAAGSEQKK